MKSYIFNFHYNKPASRAAGAPKLTVHWRGKCVLVDHIDCRVRIITKHRKTQPLCVMQGFADDILFDTERADTGGNKIITAIIK